MKKPRILSGMRPTGRLHLGHLAGALENWVRLQYEYESFFCIVDWHALTTHYDDTSGIRAGRTPWQSEHSDQLRVVERYTRSKDGKTLTLTATMTDPWSLREPVVIKHIWAWAPDQIIAPYDQCEIPTEVKKGIR